MIVFDNGEKRKCDVTSYIRGEWYGHLSDEAYFMTARTDGFTIVWPEGQDLCPDELYCLSTPAERGNMRMTHIPIPYGATPKPQNS